jgi:hypothetical protein
MNINHLKKFFIKYSSTFDRSILYRNKTIWLNEAQYFLTEKQNQRKSYEKKGGEKNIFLCHNLKKEKYYTFYICFS